MDEYDENIISIAQFQTKSTCPCTGPTRAALLQVVLPPRGGLAAVPAGGAVRAVVLAVLVGVGGAVRAVLGGLAAGGAVGGGGERGGVGQLRQKHHDEADSGEDAHLAINNFVLQ